MYGDINTEALFQILDDGLAAGVAMTVSTRDQEHDDDPDGKTMGLVQYHACASLL